MRETEAAVDDRTADGETANGRTAEDRSVTTSEDQPPASPAESLRLIREQRAEAARSLTPDPRRVYWPWLFAWLVGFGAFFLRYGSDGDGLVAMPEWVPMATLFGLMAVALVVMTVELFRAGRQVAGETAAKGTMFGVAWAVAFIGLGVIGGYLSDYLPPAQVGLFWAASSIGLVSVLYIAGAAIYSDRTMFVLGCWLAAVNMAGVLAGPGWHALIVSLAGGGGGLVLAYLGWRRPVRRR
jgi:hypothetical protein